jgi:hypothetical protein
VIAGVAARVVGLATAAWACTTPAEPPPEISPDGATIDGATDGATTGARPTRGVLYYGSYGHHDDDLVIANPWLTGALVQVYWSQAEPADGQHDFAALDARLASWRAAGKHVAVRILWSSSGYWPDPQAAHPTPAWVFAAGARHVVHEPSGTEIPLFWDPIYQRYARRFVAALAAHLADDPAVLYLEVTPGAETNPYRMGTIDALDPDFRAVFTAAAASDGTTYDGARWAATLDDFLTYAAAMTPAPPLATTLNAAGFPGEPSRLAAVGDRAVALGLGVGQNGLRGDSYTTAASVERWRRWGDQVPLAFEMSAATGAKVGTMAEVVDAAVRVGADFLNTYAIDVVRATPGSPTYDPAWQAALASAAERLGPP